ncbi:MAG: hypothetical protein ABH856_00285 [Patescibacteria group bacterium]
MSENNRFVFPRKPYLSEFAIDLICFFLVPFSIPVGHIPYLAFAFLVENPEVYSKSLSAGPKHKQQAGRAPVKVVFLAVSANNIPKNICPGAEVGAAAYCISQHFTDDFICMRVVALSRF